MSKYDLLVLAPSFMVAIAIFFWLLRHGDKAVPPGPHHLLKSLCVATLLVAWSLSLDYLYGVKWILGFNHLMTSFAAVAASVFLSFGISLFRGYGKHRTR
jgi:hypothetical protein